MGYEIVENYGEIEFDEFQLIWFIIQNGDEYYSRTFWFEKYEIASSINCGIVLVFLFL